MKWGVSGSFAHREDVGGGKVTRESLARLNIHTFKDLRRFDPDFLERKFGKNGVRMHRLSMGLDDRDVVPEHETKSVGNERTFMHDIRELEDAKRRFLLWPPRWVEGCAAKR
jgi:DNA polymerase-4